ncbi:hypothetical protein PAXRUDRAFT_826745 [Paxillus rubicundulus Ve08.2h10]|uniref:Unplaced genomic scaffold scaffold_203, whole genome shotgun sequence n=1 Tax=Paxillus rubicundulus Ve08.2h10 TaxID=930991 RepID=A0A0D0DZ69_9AGAM|nr:hypothetical protein PAXRUDRAFT_826745 [Paxillus rubicundulus Ve08.2h10]
MELSRMLWNVHAGAYAGCSKRRRAEASLAQHDGVDTMSAETASTYTRYLGSELEAQYDRKHRPAGDAVVAKQKTDAEKDGLEKNGG